MESREFWLQKNWVLQGMWAVCTLGRTILWSHTGYVWPITLSSHMISTRRWKFMLVITTLFVFLFVYETTVIWFILEPLDDYSGFLFFFSAAPQGISGGACAVPFGWLCRVPPPDYAWQTALVLQWIGKMYDLCWHCFISAIMYMPWLFLLWAWTQKSV